MRASVSASGSAVGADSRGDVELERGVVAHFLDTVIGMHSLEREASALPVEREPAEVGQQSHRAARPIDAVGPRAGRGNEIDLGHHDPARMFLAEQDHVGHEVVEVARAEGARPAHVGLRVGPAGTHEIDVGLAIDLATSQEERVDSSLCRHVEQFDAARVHGVVLAAAQDGDEHPACRAVLGEQRAGAGNG